MDTLKKLAGKSIVTAIATYSLLLVLFPVGWIVLLMTVFAEKLSTEKRPVERPVETSVFGTDLEVWARKRRHGCQKPTRKPTGDFWLTFLLPSTGVEKNKEARKASGQHSRHLLESENWFAGVGNQQGNSSFRKLFGGLPCQEVDLEGNRIRGGRPFLATFRQPTFFICNFVIFCLFF